MLENAGSYECVATNNDGESRSPARITVKKVELPTVRCIFNIQFKIIFRALLDLIHCLSLIND